MLFNPQWDKRDRVCGRVSLKALIAWLEKQPADQTYNYMAAHQCMLAQYLQAQGCSVTESTINLDDDWLKKIALGKGFDDWTYGAALERARAAQV
jgi:hypothetical protein